MMRLQLFQWLLLPLFYSLLCGVHSTWVEARCLDEQMVLLLQFKQNLSFSPSVMRGLASWDLNATDWEGVTCNQVGEVIGLDLTNKSIASSSDGMRSLFQLRHLQGLNLSSNNFNFTPIPSGFDSLPNLTYLNLSNTGFAGQIPIEISRLTRLVLLDLSTRFAGINPLKLENPDLRTLVGNLSDLRELHLDGVNISEKGNEWCQGLSSALPHLQVLSLSNCDLSGPFDSSLLELQSLSELWLARNNISTEIPEFFGNLTSLTSLDLSYCSLYGEFPKKIFQLPKLKMLDISLNPLLQGSLPEFSQDSSLQILTLPGTNFSGRLPDSIGNLKYLSSLALFDCGFNGPIPPSITNLNQLLYLDLSLNSFTDQIPSLSFSENLTHINLAHNRLSGPIPPFNRDSLQKLVNLNLRNNSLNGSITSSLFTLPSLRELYLSQNEFTGQLGEFTFESSSQLDTLDLSSNKLEGPIPFSILNISSLKIMMLSSNKFNGTLQLNSFERFTNLSNLDLSGNLWSINTNGVNSAKFPQLSILTLVSCNLRVFPDFLRDQSRLNYLDLSNNKIGGNIPSWIGNIGNGSLTYLNLSLNLLENPQQPFSSGSFQWLLVLDLHSNLLQGPIPILPPSATFLDYSNNHLSSVIPNSIGSNLPIAVFFSLSSNNFYGQIPESLCNLRYLQVLDLSNNSLSGSIPPCLGAIETLGVLNLGRNSLSGTMNQTFQKGCGLRTLALNGNRLEGQVSRTLGHCTLLEVLDLGNNRFNGDFPHWLGNLTQLRVLVLRSNHFHGPIIGIPETNKTFPMLQIIDLSNNNFTGKLPAEWFLTWKAMRIDEEETESMVKHQILRFQFLELSQLFYQDTVTVRSKGLEMELVKILTIFTSIDLSDNVFEGAIPEAIGDLKALYGLNLSNNALSGPIPSSLGNLKQLESLDLSQNELSGMIPSELAGLTFLSALNLSFNKLVGRIPHGNQFATFEEISFEGNEGLCGPPLSKDCKNSSTSNVAAPRASAKVSDGLCETFRFLFRDCADRNEFKGQLIVAAVGFGVGNGIAFWLVVVFYETRNRTRTSKQQQSRHPRRSRPRY